MHQTHTLTIVGHQRTAVLHVRHGVNLRRTMLALGVSPYTVLTRHTNCRGNGLCATCGVWIDAGTPPPRHWHDKLAARFGYPRLSCQIRVCNDMTVRLVDKLVWGPRNPRRRYRAGKR